ncbi:lipid II flippase MurJ, partial [Bifidobacterium breve]|nr:lipid II flippase MurJ [Bifidobacterium breve]
VLIAYALIPLYCGIPAISAFLLIQSTFYAFEDGLHPFLAAVLQYGFTTALMIVGMLVLPPNQWIVGIAC